MTIGVGIILDGGGTGGGIFIFGSGCSLTLDGCIITNCRNSGNGGGLLVQGNISRSSLIMNAALIENCQAGSGGGVFAAGCDIEMNGGEITGNRANNSGGGITTIAGGTRLGCTLTINGGKIIANSTVVAFGDAGGTNAFDTIVTIQNSEISNNTADNNGGGIIANNIAFMDGGAIIANGSLVSIAGAEIINNTAAGDGGSYIY
ncbi:hypothetical protein PVOR_21354 [Paenibacillus vortex V453]|uniref:Polymorphic outer membrane protein n=2 Tax=Paenibacillus TaxID=44249 RepID=A0A2R9SR73_9BACL|nr:hypothetical protein PVOR_21354 [Paenibacillus vortex V453]